MKTHWVPVSTHGHYLEDDVETPRGTLVGFHGYGELAENSLAALQAIPGSDTWSRAAISALHLFYRNQGESVAASWMTRLGREHAIADNLRYVENVVGRLRGRCTGPFVLAGFSQGAAMAARAAAGVEGVSGLIILGGDVPAEIDLSRLPRTLLGRGLSDGWYTDEKLRQDEESLGRAGVSFETVRFEGGHEWATPFLEAAGRFLKSFG